MRRIGIDVGGTNTDAVLIEDDRVKAGVKTTTTEDIPGGVLRALKDLVAELGEGGGSATALHAGAAISKKAAVANARKIGLIINYLLCALKTKKEGGKLCHPHPEV